MREFNYRWSVIPAGAITDKRVEARDLQVLCLLGRHSDKQGWLYRSQVQMARELDCGRSSVQRSIDRLVDTGWIEKQLRTVGDAAADPRHPHASYAYRVVFDRNDDREMTSEGPDESEPEEGCPPMGTPAQPDGHPGAQAYVGTKEVSILEPKKERETRTRAKLQKLKAQSATAAVDDPVKVDREWDMLPEAERDAAVDGYARWLAELKSIGRKYPFVLEKYLERRYWAGLKAPEKPADAPRAASSYPENSIEGRALIRLAKMGGVSLLKIGGNVIFSGEITPQILTFADAPPDRFNHEIGGGQFRAYDDLIAKSFPGCARARKSMIKAPWLWPPRVDGSIIQSTDPPGELSDEDARAFTGENGV